MAKNTKTATPAPQASKPAPAEPHNCECARYEVEVGTDAETMELVGTGCTATTRSTFAPGHDAKLKALLIRAGIAGQAVRRDITSSDAQTWADNFDFAHLVEHGIELGRTRAARAAKHEAEASRPDAQTVRIKVGRFVYEATLADDGSASYTTSGGQVRQVVAERIVLADAEPAPTAAGASAPDQVRPVPKPARRTRKAKTPAPDEQTDAPVVDEFESA